MVRTCIRMSEAWVPGRIQFSGKLGEQEPCRETSLRLQSRRNTTDANQPVMSAIAAVAKP